MAGGTVGGDLATLRELHRTFENSARDVENLVSNVDRALGNAVWTGTNSEKFRGAWEDFKPTLRPQLVTALDDAKEDVRTQHNNLSMATGESEQI